MRRTYDARKGRRRPSGWKTDYAALLEELQHLRRYRPLPTHRLPAARAGEGKRHHEIRPHHQRRRLRLERR
jgi:hypothetical protein